MPKYSLLLLTLVLLIACGATPTTATVSAENTEKDSPLEWGPDSIPQLKMPQVPAELKTPVDRANWLAMHYWDRMDFRDTVLLHNRDFLEQTLVNYLSFLPIANPADGEKGVAHLFEQLKYDAQTVDNLSQLADKYLYDPNSPMLNEGQYRWFLNVLIPYYATDAARSQQLAYQQRVVSTNAEGHLATNFSFATERGDVSLFDVQAPYTLVVFYDTDCDHCREFVDFLAGSEVMERAISAGKLKVLAVYPEPDKQAWMHSRVKIPASWVNGYDAQDVIQSSGKYFLRAMPTLILLDEHKMVVKKDVMPEVLTEWLKGI